MMIVKTSRSKPAFIYAFFVSCILQEFIISDGCTLPTSLQGGWKYNYTSTVVTFGATSMIGIEYTAKGDTLNAYSCISNSGNVYVMKSDGTYTDKGQNRRLYLCMKITQISDNLYYIYLLSDFDTLVDDRVYNLPDSASDNDPTCDYCTYTTPPPDSDIRPLQKTGTSESLTGNEQICLPCDAICYSNDTETTTNEIITSVGTTASPTCILPDSLVGTWKDVTKNTDVTFTRTQLSNWPAVLTGKTYYHHTCISNIGNIYVFRGDEKYEDFGNLRYYFFCMKLTEVSKDLFYYYLLSDENIRYANGERIYTPNPVPDSSSTTTCEYCSYTTEPPENDYRELRKIGSNEIINSTISPCLPCEASCDDTTTSAESTEISTTTTANSEITTSHILIEYSTNKGTTTTENPPCTLPIDLVGQWTDVSINKTISFTSTQLNDWPLTVTGKTYYHHTCISNTRNVFVFRGNEKYEEIGSYKSYFFCLRLTKISTSLFYFYLLGDKNSKASQERIYTPNTEPDISTTPTCDYCSYTTDIPNDDYREIRKLGSTEVLNTTPQPCLPCSDSCDVSTEETTSTTDNTPTTRETLITSTTKETTSTTNNTPTTRDTSITATSAANISSTVTPSTTLIWRHFTTSLEHTTSNKFADTSSASSAITSEETTTKTTDFQSSSTPVSDLTSTMIRESTSTSNFGHTLKTSSESISTKKSTFTSDTTSSHSQQSTATTTTKSTSMPYSEITSSSTAATTTKLSKSNQIDANTGASNETDLTDSAILLIVSSSVSGIFLGLSLIILGLCLMRKKFKNTPKPARHRHTDFSLTRRNRNRRDVDYGFPVP